MKTPLFKLSIGGVKTMTRRGISDKNRLKFGINKHLTTEQVRMKMNGNTQLKVGDIVYLPETWAWECTEKTTENGVERISTGNLLYKLDGDELSTNDSQSQFGRWNNKFFMPECVSRYKAKIISVGIERLRDISDEDCLKEGVLHISLEMATEESFLNPFTNEEFPTPRQAFAALVDSAMSKGTWEKNEWVEVYEYEMV